MKEGVIPELGTQPEQRQQREPVRHRRGRCEGGEGKRGSWGDGGAVTVHFSLDAGIEYHVQAARNLDEFSVQLASPVTSARDTGFSRTFSVKVYEKCSMLLPAILLYPMIEM